VPWHKGQYGRARQFCHIFDSITVRVKETLDDRDNAVGFFEIQQQIDRRTGGRRDDRAGMDEVCKYRKCSGLSKLQEPSGGGVCLWRRHSLYAGRQKQCRQEREWIWGRP